MLEKALKWMTFVCMLVLVLGCIHCSILRRMEAPQRQATPPEEIHLAGKDSGTIPRLYLEGLRQFLLKKLKKTLAIFLHLCYDIRAIEDCWGLCALYMIRKR